MKNIISKMLSFVFKNAKVIVVTIFVLILCFNYVKTKAELNQLLMKKDIKGSYAVQDVQMPISDNEYLVFQDGSFYRYKQFELLDKGTYENDHEDIYKLKSGDTDQYVICSNEKVYYYDLERNNISIYYKFSDMPTFINVNVDNE
ncbi:hypothetical protein [Aminipila sp.]|uniref:hypothetical protein n=1 Tax=Aminipila sp. TaxID=2060095 RepID=UPI002897DDD2|nr:hypothetical protein [Aminipila sp.]